MGQQLSGIQGLAAPLPQSHSQPDGLLPTGAGLAKATSLQVRAIGDRFRGDIALFKGSQERLHQFQSAASTHHQGALPQSRDRPTLGGQNALSPAPPERELSTIPAK